MYQDIVRRKLTLVTLEVLSVETLIKPHLLGQLNVGKEKHRGISTI